MNYDKLRRFASEIRINTLKELTYLGFGHYGGSLSVVEVLAVLYGEIMNIDPKNPNWEGRDYFVLSKGHAGPALYATLALKGYFKNEEIYTLNQNGTNLPSHPDRLKTKGIDVTTGSLGQGISIASGIAMSLKMDNKKNRVFVIIGDGEINEGQCWEAFQFISHNKLNNLVTFLDYNKQQLDGSLNDIINPISFKDKLESFGFKVITVNGANIEEIYEALKIRSSMDDLPLLIILDTKKGPGVNFIEKMNNSHHLRLTDDLKEEIEKVIKNLESELE